MKLWTLLPKSYLKLYYSPQIIKRNVTTLKKYIPRRAVMYVPADDKKKLMKIASVGVDCAVLECEDGVALNHKALARQNIREALDNNTIEFGRSECSVRVNSVSSGLFQEDISVVLKASKLPSTLFIPKVDSLTNAKEISSLLNETLKEKPNEKLNLVIYMESASALINLKDICQHFMDLSCTSPFLLDGIVFGGDDFIADIGAAKTKDAKEILTARQLVVATAKAFRLQAIDLVYIDYKDHEGLRKQCVEGAKMGFTGKQVIHPSQVPVVHEAFLPTTEKIQWARELVRLFDEHQERGQGAFTFKGAMIDRPLLLQAQNIIQLAETVGVPNR